MIPVIITWPDLSQPFELQFEDDDNGPVEPIDLKEWGSYLISEGLSNPVEINNTANPSPMSVQYPDDIMFLALYEYGAPTELTFEEAHEALEMGIHNSITRVIELIKEGEL